MELPVQLPHRLMMGHLFTFLLIGAAPAQGTPEAVQRLMRFVGSWDCPKGILVSGGEEHAIAYRFTARSVNDGTGVLIEESADVPGLGTLKGMNLIGFDPNLEQVHVYSIDNLGTCHDHWGYWIGADELRVQYQGVVEGKAYVEEITITLQGTGQMRILLTSTLNGAPHERMDVMLTRKAG